MMGRASRFVIRSVARLVWARSVRGLVVLLLGGVIITLVVRAVEGQGTRDPVSQPGPPQLAAGDSGKAKSQQHPGTAPVPGSQSAKRDASASYVTPIPIGTTAYTQIDAGFVRAQPKIFIAPDISDSSPYAYLKRDFLQRPRKWGVVSLPKDIQKELGDAEVYIRTGGGNVRGMWGVRGTRFYELPLEMNQFAVDGGLLPGPKNMTQLVRVYTFFMAAYERLRIDGSFKEYRFTGITRARVDSLSSGAIPLVPSFSVKVLEMQVSRDEGPGKKWPTPAGTVAHVEAVIAWGDRQDTTVVDFSMIDGYPHTSFPEGWQWGHRVWGWGIMLLLPSPPQRRGDTGPVEFEVDLANSVGVRSKTHQIGRSPSYVDTAAYAVVRCNGTPLEPQFQFRVRNVPAEHKDRTYVGVVPYDPEQRQVY
jgi:hypothetical protein